MKATHQQLFGCDRLPGFNRREYTIVWPAILLSALVFILAPGCKKFIEVPLPDTETFTQDIFFSDIMARSAVLSIYAEMIGTKGFASGGTRSISFLSSLSADELMSYSKATLPREFYENGITTSNDAIQNALWNEAYKCIYLANSVIEGLQQPNGVSDSAKKQLLGEVYFIRAFCHFHLSNLFGDVPYLTGTDYRLNSTALRQPKVKVYEQIISDLKVAIAKLTEAYTNNQDPAGRIRPNKWAATALLARVYLYNGNWADAGALATEVINHSDMYHLVDSLNDVFLLNSQEAIWQLKPNTAGMNTWEGKNFILEAAPVSEENNAAALSPQLLQAFENGDRRRSCWVGSVTATDAKVYYFPYKYKVKTGDDLTEYSMVLRLAEQYLVRAEARAELGDLAGARADLNIIRKRAGLTSTTADTQTHLLAAIAHERQVELFTEWGHRWLDLKRTGQANKVLSIAKAPYWQAFDTLYPIPENERSLNKNLTQNPGYY